jgi:hypothetical protein
VRTRRGAVATAALLASLFVACAPAPAPQSSANGRRLILAPGQTSPVPGEGVQLKFDEVLSDSRCPSDVACIQAGEAVVAVTVIAADRTRQRYEVHTSGATSLVHAGLTISCEGLEPRPVSSRPIRPADYRLTLRVSR